MLRLCLFFILVYGVSAQDSIGFEVQKDELLEKYKNIAEDFSSKVVEKKDVFFYQCKHIQGENLAKILENFLTPRGTVSGSKESDIIVVSDVFSNIGGLRKIAEGVDQYIPKIVVEARIVEFTIDEDFEKEVQVSFTRLPAGSEGFVSELSSVLSTPGANPNLTQGSRIQLSPYKVTSGNRTDLLTTFLRYLETNGKARILNATNLTVMRGEDGSIITGEEVPILTQTVTSGSVSTSTEFKSVGTKLRVKPIMIVNDKVRLQVNPEVSTVTSFASAGNGISNPVIAIRNASTTVDIRDGQMLSIGGLMRNEKRDVVRRVPILADIPLLGWFFTSNRIENIQTQVVIFLNIRTLKDDHLDHITQPGEIPDKIKEHIEKIKEAMPKIAPPVENDESQP